MVKEKPFSQFTIRGLRSGLIAIMIVQALYWFVFTPLFKVANPPDSLIELSVVDYARLSSPDDKGWDAAKFDSLELPIEDCCDPGYRGLRAQFKLDRLPPKPLGMVMRTGADNYQMKLNGTTLYKEGSLNLANLTYHGNVRTVFRLPEGVLRVGSNELDVIMARDAGAPYFNFAPPLIADYATLSTAFKYEMFTLNEFKFLSIAVGAILVFLLTIVIVRGGSSPILFWLMLVILGWTARLTYFVVTDPPIHGIGRMFYLFFFVNFVPLAWLNLANHFSGRPSQWISRVSVSAFAVLMVILGAIFHFGLFEKVDTVDRISMWFGLVMALSAMILFLRNLIRNLTERHIETALFILCLTLIVMDAVTTLLDLPFVQHVNRAMPFLVLGLIAAFLARNVRLFQSSASLNTLLEQQLTERTAELEVAHLREKEFIRKDAHITERQRIMRDMHDGLGSQLMSMLLAARRGVAKPAVVAEGLQSVIDEMRLLIDSMDSVGESLGSAFALFRDRMKDRVESAGMTFKWQDDSNGKLPDLGPREVLQVFRIMQEAVTNALKHSGGSVLSVAVSPDVSSGHSVRISISDNGAGLNKANPRGKGMESMAIRAAGFGGKLDVQSTDDGVTIAIILLERPTAIMP